MITSMGHLDDVMNVVTRRFMEILVSNSLLEISTFTQAMKLRFRRKKFRKMTMYNLQVSIRFWKSHVNKLMEPLPNFIYQKVSVI